ncbi:sodium:calcium antiporter [Acidovorax carolinensis]|uniref:Sodium:calcium antiporter n=1 Tax=Acidovorax carolinensis TaxID=553814 RepID=A0A240UIK5_9BURK|nr:calcium/sodium antiporter [Acidovorax carolinensis]ART56786.1 sodium:calcium antiporter [Acidovorax carolinensis]ART60850.1 sodium:calcium antiporter [Acidovorax carolinensis]
MDWIPLTSFIAGLVVVIVGAELIVRGGSRVGALLEVSPMILGLTVVAIGTSTPELAVGLTAAAEGNGGLAVGNIAGTNIVNILLILGLSAWIMPLKVQLLSLKLDLPVMVGSALALLWMAWDGVLSRQEGAWMVGASVLYTIAMVRVSRRESLPIQQEFSREYSARNILPRVATLQGTVSVLMLLAGIVVVVVGAELLVSGAVQIAQSLGVSDAVVGLTIVAIGTSAPELATTIMGTLKNERDIAIGNLIGSSTYNILFILGVTCLASPGGVPVEASLLHFDLPLAALVALLCVPVFATDRLISRKEGAFFVAAYAVYLGTLIFLRA